MFSRSSLSRERSEVRLVRFVDDPNSDDTDTPIRLQLHHASLDESDTHYAAISYVWGSTEDPIRISVDGSPFEIGRNLHHALAQLHRAGVKSWLWVDSICIQQSDVEEKAWQVEQMRAIFSQADLVYIWLGLGSKETDRAMDFISRVGPRALSVGTLDLWRDFTKKTYVNEYIKERLPLSERKLVGSRGEEGQVPELARFIHDLVNEQGLYSDNYRLPINSENDLLAGISDIMRRDYWHRIWIIQEITLGQEAVVLCGVKSVSLNMFDATLTGVTFCQGLDPQLWSFARALGGTFYESVALSTRRHHHWRDEDHMQICLTDILYIRAAPPHRPHYSATDPRDILFGLLGIVPNKHELGLEVDYRLSMSQVFSILTKALLREGDESVHGFHLDNCIPRKESEPDYSLPSWVPDWREIGKFGAKVYPIGHGRPFQATAGMSMLVAPLRCKPDDNLELLRRRGCRVDTVTEVMKPPQWLSHDTWEPSSIVDAQDWLVSIFDFAKLGPESGPGEDYVWRTVNMGPFFDRRASNQHLRSPVKEENAYIIRKIFRRESIDTTLLTQEQQEFIRDGIYNLSLLTPSLISAVEQLADLRVIVPQYVGSAARERTLFKTSKSMFGLGHVAIRADDIVTLMEGAQSPIILRQRDASAGGGFTFVGDAYVDSVMHGEFLKTKPTFEEFEIY